ncbi:MAG: protein-disulfide reductase DsbD [Porticoccaceae bacterium]|jgi:thiol:disulfide interchange protein|nr:protein-disulfide reductase DsbD [Porticoccaceae bacterium]
MNNAFRIIVVALAFITATVGAEELFSPKAPNTFNALADNAAFIPVEQAYQLSVTATDDEVIFNWTIRDGYYLYRDRFNFKVIGQGAELQQPVFESGKVKWDDYFEKELEVYYGQTVVRLPYASQSDLLTLQIESQGCADAGLCYPPLKQWLRIDRQSGVVNVASQPFADQPVLEDESVLSLGLVLLFAFAGGIILNLMPCVFPILSIKVLSFTMTHQTRRSRHIHGLAYTAGVVISFVAIAIVMLALRAAGESIGWGFQLQSPLFVIALVYLFFVMGLGLSGYLEIGSNLMSLGQDSQQQDGLGSSFMTGVLATTVASPCTAPFMGPALGFAIAQPSYIALLVFAFLGLGMALPFILLAWLPGLSQKLPKPGAWMDSFKQFLAFPLYLTAVWLLWVAGRQTSTDVAATAVAGLVLLVMGLWLWKQSTKPVVKLTSIAVLASALAAPYMALEQGREKADFEVYSPQRLAELRASGQPVFINLTADWCITCLVNERVALGSDKVKALISDSGVVYLKGDWTNSDAQITELLTSFRRSGVPLYLLYPKGPGEPVILPQILTETTMIEAINFAIK